MSWEKYIRDGIGAVSRADFDHAESALKKALHIAKETYPRGDGRMAVTLSLLGHVYFKNRDFARAELLLEQSLRLHSQQVDTHFNEPCVLMDLFSLGEIKKSVGKGAEACRLYDDTVKKLRDSGQHRRLVVQQATQEFEQMLQTTKQQLSQRELTALENDPVSTETPVDCMPVQKPRASAEASNALPEERVAIAEQPAPPPNSARVQPDAEAERGATEKMIEVWHQQLNNGLLALSAEDDERDNLITAYLNCESAFRLVQTLFPENDVRYIATLRALADASAKMRLFDQAERLYLDAAAIVKQAPSLVVSSHHAIRISLGLLYIDRNEFAKAKDVLSAEEIPSDLRTTPAFASLCQRLNKANEAIRVYEQASELMEQARSVEAGGDPERAGRLANNAVSLLKQAFPPNHQEHARVLRYRADLYRKLGNVEQANEIERRVERIERANEVAARDWAKVAEDLPPVTADIS